jgi:mono/diheme cytochrome c family protein
MVPARSLPLLLALLSVTTLPAGFATAGSAGDRSGLLATYCAGCHTDGGSEGGLDLDALQAVMPGPDTARGVPADSPEHRRWVAVWHNLRAGTMPPAGEPQPTAEERTALAALVQSELLGVDASRPDPGQVVLRRLNRGEYARTIRDLLGVEFDAENAFPPDDTGHGFDTIGEVLGISPLLLEQFMAAARTIAAEAVSPARQAALDPRAAVVYPPKATLVFGPQPLPGDAASGDERLRAILRRLASRGFRRPVGEDTLERIVGLARAAADTAEPDAAEPDAMRRWLEHAVEAGITAVLGSPRFLFRVEAAADGGEAMAGSVPIDEHALASRLSYFLWGTMPDDELFRLADRGRLRDRLTRQVDRMIDDPRTIALANDFVGQWLQTRDVEGRPFDLNRIFGRGNRRLAERVFDHHLRRAMRQETELLFLHLLQRGLPATDLLTASYTFLNGPLAAFYGIEGIPRRSPSMRLVTLDADSHRGGLLTHAAVLAVTSNPSRTSPVKRGLFILENLLGTPPPPAPPDVPLLENAAEQVRPGAKPADLSMRELMEVHRRQPACASCHARMDPLGLALECYDAIGRWRDAVDGQPVDTAGRLATGESFADVRELAALIAHQRRDDFHRCLAEKMLTFALGRGIEYFDAPAVDIMVDRLGDDGSLRSLVHAVVESVPFQRMRSPDAE